MTCKKKVCQITPNLNPGKANSPGSQSSQMGVLATMIESNGFDAGFVAETNGI